MNFLQETAFSDTSSTHNSLYSSSSQSQATPPLTSTPTSATITTPICVPPLRPKKILSMCAQEFVPTTPPSFKQSGNEFNFTNSMNRQRFGGGACYSGNTTLPLNMSTSCNLLNNATQNQLFLRQHQILQEKQQLLLQKQQLEYAAATRAKQQFILSTAAAANHPQDEIANSLKMFAVLSACNGNETPPSPDEVMQDFATNGYITDELNRYHQHQTAASNMHTIANSNVYPNSQNLYQYDNNMNATNGYINWLYNHQLQNENSYNELWRQNFLKMIPQHLIRQSGAATAASINMDYNNQYFRARKTHFKKETQAAVRRCVFCENNNEPEAVVKSHAVRDSQGRVLCPKLRIYVCPICGASGDDAHTVKYCPQKPIITMEDAMKAETIRSPKSTFTQKPAQMNF